MKKWVAISVAGALVVGGLAFLGYRIYLNEVDDSAIELVPPDAVLYANVYLNPSTRQKQALRDLLRHFPAAGSPEEARTRVEELLDDALAGLGLEFGRDVEPWLGRQVGLYVRAGEAPGDPTIALLVATKDADATRDAVAAAMDETGDDPEARSYEGVSYEVTQDGTAVGIVGDFLVVASGPDEIEASVDAVDGRSLAETVRFTEATAALPSDRVALFYSNLEPLLGRLRREQGVPFDEAEAAAVLGSPGAAAAYLRPNGIVIDASFPGTGGRPGHILAGLPETAWAAFGLDDLGGLIQSRLDLFGVLGSAGAEVALKNGTGLDLQDDLLAWMGDAALYLGGRPADVEGAIVLESTDPAASDAALDKIQIALIRTGSRLRPLHVEGFDGFTISDPSQPDIPLISVLSGDRVIVSNSRDAAIEATRGGERLGDDSLYSAATTAIGETFGPAFYLDAGALLDGIGDAFETSSPDQSSEFEADIRPDLDPFSFIIYGTRPQAGRTYARLLIGVE